MYDPPLVVTFVYSQIALVKPVTTAAPTAPPAVASYIDKEGVPTTAKSFSVAPPEYAKRL
jgi:hypothetical protein